MVWATLTDREEQHGLVSNECWGVAIDNKKDSCQSGLANIADGSLNCCTHTARIGGAHVCDDGMCHGTQVSVPGTCTHAGVCRTSSTEHNRVPVEIHFNTQPDGLRQ